MLDASSRHFFCACISHVGAGHIKAHRKAGADTVSTKFFSIILLGHFLSFSWRSYPEKWLIKEFSFHIKSGSGDKVTSNRRAFVSQHRTFVRCHRRHRRCSFGCRKQLLSAICPHKPTVRKVLSGKQPTDSANCWTYGAFHDWRAGHFPRESREDKQAEQKS